MRIIKQRKPLVPLEDYFEQRICDICKQEITEDDELYTTTEVKVGMETVIEHPNETDCYGLLIDCCVNCFEEKIVPLIQNEFDVKFREYPTSPTSSSLLDTLNPDYYKK